MHAEESGSPAQRNCYKTAPSGAREDAIPQPSGGQTGVLVTTWELQQLFRYVLHLLWHIYNLQMSALNVHATTFSFCIDHQGIWLNLPLQVITRTSGLQLGVISHFLVDPRTVSVIFLHLRAKGLGGQEVGVVELSALTQIADVVLVHDESALEDELRSRGLVKLVGYSVQAYDGTPLGKVWPGENF